MKTLHISGVLAQNCVTSGISGNACRSCLGAAPAGLFCSVAVLYTGQDPGVLKEIKES